MKTIIKFITIHDSLKVTVLILLIGFMSCKKDSTNTSGSASYSGTFVKSSATVVSSASGTATATFNQATMVLSYTLSWSGLSSNPSVMHFHDNGVVMAEISGFTPNVNGSVSGTITLTAQQSADLASGKIYAQIHTVNTPAGEIKATLSKNSSSSSSNSGGSYGY
jgi:hypothetical protein